MRGGPAAEFRHRHNNLAQGLFCLKLELVTVSEALADTILILLMFSIVLVHQRDRLMGPPGHP